MPIVPSIRASGVENKSGFMLRMFGFELTRTKAAVPQTLQSLDRGNWWWPIIRESFTGAWQKNEVVTVQDTLGYWAQFRCISLISGDIAKCRVKLVEQDSDDIWIEIDSPSFSPVLRKPNHFQNRIQFFAHWMESKLTRGNTYVLKVRDNREVVRKLIVLDPTRVTPLLADDGSVFYRLATDKLAGLDSDVPAIPASEIIHDRWNTFYHPLVGLSPIYAAGINALMGVRIQNNSARFFGNGARPSGVLTAPGAISDETAATLKEYWNANFTGENAGKVAVVGDGLKYEQMTMSAVDAQLIEQLKWNDAIIAGAFGVPAYMINAGTAPAYNNVEALNQQYYSQCLQIHIESIELCLDEGLGLTEVTGKTYGTEFDLDDLLRMDTATQIKTMGEAVKGILSADEARKRLGYGPTAGGAAVLTQQQNYSLAALEKRDAKDDPFAGPTPPPSATSSDEEEEEADNDNEEELAAAAQFGAWELKRHLDLLAA